MAPLNLPRCMPASDLSRGGHFGLLNGTCASNAGRYALGSTGFWGILILAFTEFFGDSLIVLIVMWQEISALLTPLQGEPHATLFHTAQ